MTQEQIHKCWNCGKRLPIDDLVGEVTVFCKGCKKPNRVKTERFDKVPTPIR